jgi:hypothetical protein
VDKKTEILAGAGTYAEHANASKLIVFDPSQNGTAQIKATVGDALGARFRKRVVPVKDDVPRVRHGGLGPHDGRRSGPQRLTPVDAPGQRQRLRTHDPFGLGSKVAAKGSMTGRIRFVFTDAKGTQTFDGLVLKGQGKAGGKAIGGFTR